MPNSCLNAYVRTNRHLFRSCRFPINLVLEQSHQAEIIIVNNVLDWGKTKIMQLNPLPPPLFVQIPYNFLHQTLRTSAFEDPPCPKSIRTRQNPSPLTADLFLWTAPLIVQDFFNAHNIASKPKSVTINHFMLKKTNYIYTLLL